jgi:hypothetical protein
MMPIAGVSLRVLWLIVKGGVSRVGCAFTLPVAARFRATFFDLRKINAEKG